MKGMRGPRPPRFGCALSGVELILDRARRWSAGIEAGYWYALSREPAASPLAHFTAAALLRLRM